jgi:Tfp pilus assembly protein PilF
MMEQDGTRAKEVFGRLTSGEHAAAQDPLVLAWSHVHLGTIYDIEGQPDRAKSEYEAALAVEGAPEKAKQAASKALGAMVHGKSPERP